ncbi:hypothetical protein AB0D12_08710 [Streptomyces sp. NPDC048479]|uniref:hypothetical protein n=1 Tax=Streptomyces sp. NPDC048479 TaxID=3154725 RepID=UPI0034442723
MALHPEGIFTSGPLFQLVSLAAWHDDPLEWQVLRLQRIVRTEYWDAHWRHPMQPLASQLDYMAATLTKDFFASCPPAAQEAWTTAAGNKSVAEFMRELAMLLRVADRDLDPDYDEIPLVEWEVRARFPLLLALGNWAYDDEYDSFEASVQGRIDAEHPFCDRELVPIIAQAMEALALCAQSGRFASALESYASGATSAALATLTDLGHAHMRARHRP